MMGNLPNASLDYFCYKFFSDLKSADSAFYKISKSGIQLGVNNVLSMLQS